MKSRIAILSAVFTTVLSAGAFADWDTLGRVDVGPRRDRDRIFNLGGPVDSLQLRAERNDVDCRSVTATFNRGGTQRIYSGRLREGQPVNVDLPGRDRFVSRLEFDCRSFRPASISVVADVGNNNRDAWRRGPNWQRQWANVFNWGSNAINDWQMVGSETFDGRNDSERSYAGWQGRRVDAVALKPLDADARCSRVVARFDNGRQQVLNLHNGDLLRRGQFEKLDLPGNVRNLQSLDMRCSAVNARRVTIQTFTSH